MVLVHYDVHRGEWRDRVAGVGGVGRVVRARVHVARGGLHAALGAGAAAGAGGLRAAAARARRARAVAPRHGAAAAALLPVSMPEDRLDPVCPMALLTHSLCSPLFQICHRRPCVPAILAEGAKD